MDPRPRLRDDPALAATTFVIIDFESTTPTGARPEPIDVATIQLRRDHAGWAELGRFSELICPPTHAPVTPFDTAQTGITSQMVAIADPAPTVLSTLDSTLTDKGPYLLVAHNANTEAGMLHDYRDHCPRLAHTDLLDTVKLARALYPELASHRLDALLEHLEIPQPTDRHRALPDVQVTATLFCRMLAHADRTHTWTSLADLRRAALLVARSNRPQQEDLFDGPWT